MKLFDGVFTVYVGKLFLIRFLLLLVIISIIWQMLDLLNVSDAIMAVEGAGGHSLMRYISLAMPQILSQFAPFAALLAIVFTLTSLSITSEITIMRAAGMSVNRVLFPLLFVCVFIAIGHFAFQELVAVKSSEKLEYWRANDFGRDLPPSGSLRTDIRLNYDSQFIEAKSARREGERTVLNDLTIYERDGLRMTHVLIADEAVFTPQNNWVLQGIKRSDTATQNVEAIDAKPWAVTFQPDFLFALSLNPDRTSLTELWQKISQLRQDNADTRAEMTSYLSRFSKPLSTLIMPLLGAIAGFGIHRQGVMLARAVNGSVLGFSYFVLENISLALGKLGVLPAVVGAFFPLILFLIIGFSLVLAMESK